MTSRPWSTRTNWGSLEKWLIPGLGKGKDKMKLVHLVRPESNEAASPQNDGDMLKGLMRGRWTWCASGWDTLRNPWHHSNSILEGLTLIMSRHRHTQTKVRSIKWPALFIEDVNVIKTKTEEWGPHERKLKKQDNYTYLWFWTVSWKDALKDITERTDKTGIGIMD